MLPPKAPNDEAATQGVGYDSKICEPSKEGARLGRKIERRKMVARHIFLLSILLPCRENKVSSLGTLALNTGQLDRDCRDDDQMGRTIKWDGGNFAILPRPIFFP
jgi:hypothetical protein